jgi:peptidoglycan/LPS O-acetylase OafA/YrhL
MIQRIRILDGIRGFAVLIVVLFHYLNNSYLNSDKFQLNNCENLFSSFTSYGWAGVNLFFVISGYLIGTILLLNKRSDNVVKVFYIRRFLRIVPLYFFLLITYYIYNTHIIMGRTDRVETHIPLEYYFGFVQNYFMSSHGIFGSAELTPTWSLAVEEQFYLVIPLIIYFFRERSILFLCVFCIGYATIHRLYSDNWYEEYTHFFSRMDAPFLGLLLALKRNVKSLNGCFIFQRNFEIFILLFLLLGYSISNSFNHLLISYLFYLIVDRLLNAKPESVWFKLLTLKFILILGKYSYFIYLFHQLINYFCFAFLQNWSVPNLNSWVSYFIEIFSFLITLFAAFLSFKYFEKPLINVGQRFVYKYHTGNS